MQYKSSRLVCDDISDDRISCLRQKNKQEERKTA